MNNKSSPARGRKRVTQCAGMRIKNSTRIWRSKHNWYCHGLENRSSATACRFESCLLRHTYGSIAQLAEHLISNQEVVGSSPTGASNRFHNASNRVEARAGFATKVMDMLSEDVIGENMRD